MGKQYIGRDIQKAQIYIEDSSVNRLHAIISATDSSLLIKDLNSTSGTYVNGKKIKPDSEIGIHDDDTIAFGNSNYVYHAYIGYLELGKINYYLGYGTQIIGKDKESHITVDDYSVDYSHALINVTSNEVLIEDLNSTTGTTINHERINPGYKIKLHNEDIIGIEKKAFVYHEYKNKCI